MERKTKEYILEEVQDLYRKILDDAEVAIGHTEQYKTFRSRVLRHGNNCLRNIEAYLMAKDNLNDIRERNWESLDDE